LQKSALGDDLIWEATMNDDNRNPRNAEMPRVSRRNLFRKVLGGAALTGASAFSFVSLTGPVQAQWGHVWKSIALYQPGPNGPQRCGNCFHFRPPAACQIVEPPIHPGHWCQYWAPRGRARY
jgi:hypothetical protein